MSVRRRMMLVVRDAVRRRRRTLRRLLADHPPIADGLLKLAGPPKLRDLLNADGPRTTAGPWRVERLPIVDALLIVDAQLRVHQRSHVSKRIVADPKDPRLNVRRVRLHRPNASHVQCSNGHRLHARRLRRNSSVRKLNALLVRYNSGHKPSVRRLRSSNARRLSA